MSEGKGIWVDGRLSREELDLLLNIQKKAIALFQTRQLPEGPKNPWKYDDEKLTFKAWRQGTNMVVFYGWNFPPKDKWVNENKHPTECQKCFPLGLEGPPRREVWCEKMNYNFERCPYGVPTPTGMPSR